MNNYFPSSFPSYQSQGGGYNPNSYLFNGLDSLGAGAQIQRPPQMQNMGQAFGGEAQGFSPNNDSSFSSFLSSQGKPPAPQAPQPPPVNQRVVPQYSKGGSAKQNLHSFADMLRSFGQGSDKVLAHINPQEAQELGQKYGGDVNPHTGLPQFGFFSDLLKDIGGLALPMLGAAFGGPLGGIAGGALGGVAKNSGGNRGDMLRGALGGGLSSYLTNSLAPMLGKAFGSGQAAQGFGGASGASSSSPSFFASLFGGNSPQASGSGPASSGPNPSSSNQMMQVGGSPQQGGEGQGFLSRIGSALTADPLNTLLGATQLVGTLGRRESVPKPQSFSSQLEELEKQRDTRSLKDVMRENNEYGDEMIPEEELEPERFGRFRKHFRKKKAFKEGGYVEGESGGQDDDVPYKLPVGAYVLDAITVSHAGDGNNKAGAKVLDEYFQKIPNYNHGGEVSRSKIDALVSTGEYIISPEIVESLGKGSNERGAKVLDSFRKTLSKHKGQSKFPPKSHSINHYMKKSKRVK